MAADLPVGLGDMMKKMKGVAEQAKQKTANPSESTQPVQQAEQPPQQKEAQRIEEIKPQEESGYPEYIDIKGLTVGMPMADAKKTIQSYEQKAVCTAGVPDPAIKADGFTAISCKGYKQTTVAGYKVYGIDAAFKDDKLFQARFVVLMAGPEAHPNGVDVGGITKDFYTIFEQKYGQAQSDQNSRIFWGKPENGLIHHGKGYFAAPDDSCGKVWRGKNKSIIAICRPERMQIFLVELESDANIQYINNLINKRNEENLDKNIQKESEMNKAKAKDL